MGGEKLYVITIAAVTALYLPTINFLLAVHYSKWHYQKCITATKSLN